MKRIRVPGGSAVLLDLFDLPRLFVFPVHHCSVADPPYGKGIIKDEWSNVGARQLSVLLTDLSLRLAHSSVGGGHFWLWGGIGTPGERALYRTLLLLEAETDWRMAEQVTWRKKRGYGTKWRCLMNREECLRFVLGDPKRPRFYAPQHTSELRGYAGWNERHPARSPYKRLTMVWDHASDMGKKPHPCHKPRPLCESQVLSCTMPGDTVLDLFAGSGEVSLAARDNARKFVAYEGDPEQFDKLVARLRA